MNKKQLKQLMKPMIKECIHEILLEEGVLSNIVSEVAKGLQTNTITESVQRPPPQAPSPALNVKPNKSLVEHRQKLLGAINKDAYNGVDLFEDTTPFSGYEGQDRTPNGGPDLGDPRDAGVDISSVMGASSEIWKRMK